MDWSKVIVSGLLTCSCPVSEFSSFLWLSSKPDQKWFWPLNGVANWKWLHHSTSLLYKWSVEFFVYLYTFNFIRKFVLAKKCPLIWNFGGFGAFLDSKCLGTSTTTQKGTFLLLTESFEPCLCDARCQYTVPRKTVIRKKSQSLYISHVRGAPLSNR